MTDLVKARWVAGFTAELPDKTTLVPGVTVADIPADEAKNSDHWQPVKADKPAKENA